MIGNALFESHAWLAMVAAGCCEILATSCIKMSDGLRKARWMGGFALTMGGSLYLMSLAVSAIPMGTVYAVWTGIGAVGTALVGMIAFSESKNPLRLACIALIIAGVIGLRISSGG